MFNKSRMNKKNIISYNINIWMKWNEINSFENYNSYKMQLLRINVSN